MANLISISSFSNFINHDIVNTLRPPGIKLFSLFPHRIQQLQLQAQEIRTSEHNQLWNQIEAEIHLHRHKTVIRACRRSKNPNVRPPAPDAVVIEDSDDSVTVARKRRGIGEPRLVKMFRDRSEGLGISITVSFAIRSLTIIVGLEVDGQFFRKVKHK